MLEQQPQLDGNLIMRQYNDLQETVQDYFVSCPAEMFSRLQGDGSNVKQDLLNNATQVLEQLNAQKKKVETLLGLSPGTDKANAGIANYEIDSVATALLKTIQTGIQQNNNLFKPLLPQFPSEALDFMVLGRLVIHCIENMIVLCAQTIEALER